MSDTPLHGNRYEVDAALIGRSVELHGVPWRSEYPGCMQVSVELSAAEVAWIDRAVAVGLFESRDAAIRGAINGAIGDSLDDAAITEAYRRGYEAHPEDEGLGEAGLQLLSDTIRTKPKHP